MNFIGSGAQYRIYDTLDGRVLKMPLTHDETAKIVAGWYASGKIPTIHESDDYTANAKASVKYFKRLTARYPDLSESLGNPQFLEGASYSQEKVQLLGEALRNTDLSNGKLLIDKYIELIITHWRYGFGDNVFNFTINNGVDSHQKLVLLDFGEVSFQKRDIEARISDKRWLKAWSYTNDCSEGLKPYYAEKMNNHVTVENLRTSWKKSI